MSTTAEIRAHNAALKPAAYALRLPRGLYDELVGEAAKEGVSVNLYIVAVLAGALNWKQP
jgi:predicted HicB family RNase H-like nuclease